MTKRQRKAERVKVIIKHEYKQARQERAITEDLQRFYLPLSKRRV